MNTTVIPAGATLEDEDQFDSRAQYLADAEKEQEVDVLAGLRELEGADGARWRIYRLGADDPSLNGFLDEVSTVQLSAVWIRDKFGGGKYRVRGHMAGNGRIIAHRTIEIAGDAPRNVKTSQAAVAMQATSNIDDWERRQEIRDERRRKERNELLTILVPALAPLGAALVQGMMGNRGPDLTALITALKPPDPMQTIAALKQLMPENQQPPTSAFDNALKLIDKFRDIAPAEGGTNWMDLGKELIRTLGPVAAPAIEAAMIKAQSAAVSSSVPPALVPAGVSSIAGSVSAVSSENPQMFGMLALLPWLKEQMAMALTKAATGSNPELIAERIIDDLPSSQKPESLLEFIERPDWFQKLQQFEPRVATYHPWFLQMRNAMIAVIRDTGESPVQVEGPTMSVTQLPEASGDEPDRPSGEPPKLGL